MQEQKNGLDVLWYFLLITIIILVLPSCGQNEPFVSQLNQNPLPVTDPLKTEPATPDPVIPEPNPEIPSSILLTAKKMYKPSSWEDGVYDAEVSFLVKIPEHINVISGNAGNHRLRIYFDNIKCIYKGGASVSKPLSNPGDTHQINLGKKYHFEKCVDENDQDTNLNPLEYTPLTAQLKLRIDNGDSTETTVVEHEFEATE